MAIVWSSPFIIGMVLIMKERLENQRRSICSQEIGHINVDDDPVVAEMLSYNAGERVVKDSCKGVYVVLRTGKPISASHVAIIEADRRNQIREAHCSLLDALMSFVAPRKR